MTGGLAMAAAAVMVAACGASRTSPPGSSPLSGPSGPQSAQRGRYATIGPLSMYYEVHGSGAPVVLIHGGGSTIQTSFGALLPRLAATRQVIAVELQAHGRTADVDRPLQFTQDADDVAALLHQLGIARADIIGYSNGGTTAVQIALRHPAVVRSLVIISGILSADGMVAELRQSFDVVPTPEMMPASLREAYLAVAPRPQDLPIMIAKSVERMRHFEDIPLAKVHEIAAPALVISGDRDVARLEHTVEMVRAFRRGSLAILPHTDHAQIVERVDLLLPMIEPFLAA